jgi:hypothetical protein
MHLFHGSQELTGLTSQTMEWGIKIHCIRMQPHHFCLLFGFDNQHQKKQKSTEAVSVPLSIKALPSGAVLKPSVL